MIEFVECQICAAKPGSPDLCAACLHNRSVIDRLRRECEVLTDVYAVAACLRTFPVPLNDYLKLADASDTCRTVLEPPIDDHAPSPEEIAEIDGPSCPPPRPLVGICVVIVKEGKILIGKRRGSHGDGEYSTPGGHLEHGESFEDCARREVLEETGLQIGRLRFLRVLNCTTYAPKHYVDVAFAAEWKSGEPEVREPDKVESWSWYFPDDLPSPLFSMVPSAIAALLDGHDLSLRCEDLP